MAEAAQSEPSLSLANHPAGQAEREWSLGQADQVIQQIEMARTVAQAELHGWGVAEALGLGDLDKQVLDDVYTIPVSREYSVFAGEALTDEEKGTAIVAIIDRQIVGGTVVKQSSRNLDKIPFSGLRRVLAMPKVQGHFLAHMLYAESNGYVPNL